MTQCVQYFDQITASAQMVTAGAVVCTICWGVLIWCAIKVRKAARQVQEASRALDEPFHDTAYAKAMRAMNKQLDEALSQTARANDALRDQIKAHQAKETDHAE